MATLKELKGRISSVKSTQKITKAKQMVAAAKLRKAQAAAEAARPYAQRMEAVVSSLASRVTRTDKSPKLLAGTGKDQVQMLVVLTSDRGLAGGAFWAVDYGPELSRGFRALKVWAHLKEHGFDALGEVIDRNIEQAQYLEGLVKASSKLEMLAPVPLNICCFRYKFDKDTDDLNDELVIQLHEKGIAVPSTTRIHGQLAIRVNITNHRTRFEDLDILVEAIENIGDSLA